MANKANSADVKSRAADYQRYKDMKRLTGTVLIIFIFFLVQVTEGKISSIKAIDVLDNKFKIVKSIQNEETLKNIEELWNNLIAVEAPPNYDWDYRLDIQSSNIGDQSF